MKWSWWKTLWKPMCDLFMMTTPWFEMILIYKDPQRSSMMGALLILLNKNMALPSLDYIKYKIFILMSFVYLEFPYPIQTDNVKFLPLWKSYTFSISSLKCPQPNSIVIYIAPLIFFAPTKFSLCSLWIPYPYSTGFWEWQRSFSRTSDKKR